MRPFGMRTGRCSFRRLTLTINIGRRECAKEQDFRNCPRIAGSFGCPFNRSSLSATDGLAGTTKPFAAGAIGIVLTCVVGDWYDRRGPRSNRVNRCCARLHHRFVVKHSNIRLCAVDSYGRVGLCWCGWIMGAEHGVHRLIGAAGLGFAWVIDNLSRTLQARLVSKSPPVI